LASQYGLTSTGFVIPTIVDLRDEIEGLLRAKFGASLPLGDGTLLGFMIGILCERLVLLWELTQGAWSALDPDQAQGVALEALALLTGTFRLAAASSTVIETLCGDPGTVVASGFAVSTLSTGVRFASVLTSTLVSVPAWLPSTAYVVGDRRTNGGNMYRCSVAGVSAGSGGPVAGSNPVPADGGVTWQYIGEGTAFADVPMASSDKGTIVAVAGDLNQIANPLGGLNTATNLLDATSGRLLQSDQDLRLLRTSELASDGNSPPDAILAKLLKIDGVTAAKVFYNPTDIVDADGLDPHCVEILVQGGADQDIWNVLWTCVAGGINTKGTEVGTVVDSEGTNQTLRFSRTIAVPIYTALTLTKDPKTYSGNAAVQAAVALGGNLRAVGSDAVRSKISSFADAVAGVIDVVQVLLYTDVIGAPAAWVALTPYVATVGARSVVINDGGRCYICITSGNSAASGGPLGIGTDITDGTVHWRYLGNTVAIDSRHLATYDTTRVSVTSTDGTL
jgi:uncharacterized phage protein gp47/JayE